MAADGIVMVGVDLENLLIIGAILIAVWTVVSLAMEAFLLNGNSHEAAIWGIFEGSAFAIVFLFAGDIAKMNCEFPVPNDHPTARLAP